MVKPVPEVVAVLERWRPATWNERDLQTLEPLLPTVRGWVKQMDLSNAHKTRGLLRAASGIAVWALRSFGNADPTVVFHSSNIETWTMTVRTDKSIRWRETTRSRLRALGRVVNPDGWPPTTRKVGRQPIARPYTTLEERVFRLAGGLPGRANRSQRLWIVCGSLGAGLKGVETRRLPHQRHRKPRQRTPSRASEGDRTPDWCRSEPNTPTSPERPSTHPPRIGLFPRVVTTLCIPRPAGYVPPCRFGVLVPLG